MAVVLVWRRTGGAGFGDAIIEFAIVGIGLIVEVAVFFVKKPDDSEADGE